MAANEDRQQNPLPLHPAHNAAIGERHWQDAPARRLGPHDGLPDRLRDKR